MKSWRVYICACSLLLDLATAGAGTLAQFRTVFGDLELELYDQDKPVTVQNFIHYVQSGRYQDGFSHRLVPNFVVQGGGFTVPSRGRTNNLIYFVEPFATITNEFGVGRRFSNTYGTIAMAKLSGDTNSASSQWFINLANNAFLDANDTNDLFVVFGHVIKGTNVLNILNHFQYPATTQPTNVVENGSSIYPAFDTFPLLHLSQTLNQTNFLYFDISLLQVGVDATAGGGKSISWNSATGLTNVVEFTTSFPPQWQTLARTNGTGARMTVQDTANDPGRFYRVRVEP